MPDPASPDRAGGPRRLPPPSGVDPLERLLAHEEIRQLACRHAQAMDARDLDGLVELFVEDFRHRSGAVGREALRGFLSQAFAAGAAGKVSFAHVGTHVINLLDGDRAEGTVYCLAEIGDEDRWIRQTIAYEDVYERRDGTWYFKSRDHELFYGVELGYQPLDQPAAEWPKAIVGRGTVPFRWGTWESFQEETGAR